MQEMSHTLRKVCEAVAMAANDELFHQKQLGRIEDPVDEPILAVRAALVFAVTVITRTLKEGGDAEVRALMREEFDMLLKEARGLRAELRNDVQERSAWDA